MPVWIRATIYPRNFGLLKSPKNCFSSIVRTTALSTNETQPVLYLWTQTESGRQKLKWFGCILCVGKFRSNESGPQPKIMVNLDGWNCGIKLSMIGMGHVTSALHGLSEISLRKTILSVLFWGHLTQWHGYIILAYFTRSLREKIR